MHGGVSEKKPETVTATTKDGRNVPPFRSANKARSRSPNWGGVWSPDWC